jgi:hypothetical protein
LPLRLPVLHLGVWHLDLKNTLEDNVPLVGARMVILEMLTGPVSAVLKFGSKILVDPILGQRVSNKKIKTFQMIYKPPHFILFFVGEVNVGQHPALLLAIFIVLFDFTFPFGLLSEQWGNLVTIA